MDKRRFYLKFLFVLFVVFFQSSSGTLDLDDDDDDFSSNRCPFIRNRLKNGRVKIRSRGRVAKFQCDSGYDLAGKRFATCVRGQWNNPIPFCVARGCPRRPYVPNSRVSEMFRGAVLTYECLPGYSLLAGSGVIYCDGRRWSLGTPECEASLSNPPTFCDFEPLDLCGWTHDPTHDFDWKRNQYATPSGHVGTGPSFDHTFGPGKGGVYLYMETSSPRKPDDTARIFSPVFPSDQSGGCFSFWYHMYGESTGGLKVYIRPESYVFGELKPTWELYGDQGNEWFQEKLIVPATEEDFQIIIEGIRGDGYLGDIAIDDVSLTPTICEDIKVADNGSETEMNPMSCRGRCKDPPTDLSCSCLDTCFLDKNCCRDYHAFCSSTTAPDEIISETTTKVSQFSELPNVVTSTEPADSSTLGNSDPLYLDVTTYPPSEPNPPLISSSTEQVIQASNSTTTIVLTSTTTQKPPTSPPVPPFTKPTTTSTTTTTTEKTTTTTTTTPKPTTTTTPKPTITTTTPNPTTTTTDTTTPTTPKPTTTTTTITPKPTTTTTTPKPTTTTPIPTTTTTVPTTTTSTTLKPTTTTFPTTTTTEREQFRTVPEAIPPTTYAPETRRTYNLRPRNRTTVTTPMTIPRTTTKATTSKRTTESATTKVTTKAPTTTTTQRSKFKLTTDDAFAFKDIRPSKEASSKGQPTAAIVCVTLFVMAAVATISAFLFRKWKANKESKMADDSELRFLSENEVVEFSDACENDRHNIQQPMIE